MKTIGFIGVGVMGKPMVRNLMKKGFPVSIYTRTKSKVLDVIEEGAVWCDDVKTCVQDKDVIITIVGYPKDVEEVYLGKDGIIEADVSGKLFCDMTTTKPSLDAAIAEKVREKGGDMADAPVSGGDTGARNGTLSIMVGASAEAFEALMPLFSVMGKSISLMGDVGAGQHTKMANQIVIAGTMCGVSEALIYGAKAGLDLEKMVATISKGAAGCWTLDNLAPRVLKGDYAPGFMVEHFIKDMGIALEEAEMMELSLPSLALARQLYLAVKAQGCGRNGTQVLVKALESLAGKEIL